MASFVKDRCLFLELFPTSSSFSISNWFCPEANAIRRSVCRATRQNTRYTYRRQTEDSFVISMKRNAVIDSVSSSVCYLGSELSAGQDAQGSEADHGPIHEVLNDWNNIRESLSRTGRCRGAYIPRIDVFVSGSFYEKRNHSTLYGEKRSNPVFK